MINKNTFKEDMYNIIDGGFRRREVRKLPRARLYEPAFARLLYQSNGSGEPVDEKYDPWANLTEWDGGLEDKALEGLSLRRKSHISRFITCYADTLTRKIQKSGGFPGGIVSPTEIAEDFISIFMYVIATVDSGEVIRLYEDMFLAYQSGGWPCGWLGKYPEGKIVVFYPS